ncbi:hypothetical protein BH20VER3_BH20VER3_14880 [soil metagenome]
MPEDPPTPSLEPLSPGILLVEEYSALGVAISSALKKFAPLHAVRVAHNFAEAEAFAAELRPELFILDLDPPPTSGEIEFFYNLKRNYPQARVLVIAAGTSRELRAQRGTAGAIQFVEKPFDLAEFGAAVQALLGPWTLPSASQQRGTLQDLDLVDIVQLKCLAGSSAVLRVESTQGKSGEIHLRKGQIWHVVTSAASGQAAFKEIATWPEAHLTESEPPFTIPRTIDQPWPIVLLQVVRELGPSRQRKAPSDSTAPARPLPAKTGKKILVVDDTEMLLIFVEDVLATADPNLQILTAATGAEGIRLARSAQPHLVLLDYSLTDTTGDQVCRALRDEPATARIPILMMSGHISELIKTEADYENVVDALPKPFLSGALINAVEKALATGPLPAPARPAPAAPATTTSAPTTPSPNGDGATKPSPSASLPPSSHPPGAQPITQAPARAEATSRVMSPPREQRSSTFSAPGMDRPTELTVTLSLKVVDMRFRPSFALAEARLELFDPVASVKMGQQKEVQGVPLESGFRLHRLTLNGIGQIDRVRLVPTRRPPQLPVPNNSFPVATTILERVDAETELTLTAPADMSMRVVLTAAFELTSVELSDSFEVEALLLRAGEQRVFLRNAGVATGQPFEIIEVQLDASSELSGMLVRVLSER